MDEIYEICFQIISVAGSACSHYMEAVHEAKSGNFEKAESLMDQGIELFRAGHNAHAGLIHKEAAGEQVHLCLMLMHSEDQLMRTEIIKTMAEELIDIHKKL